MTQYLVMTAVSMFRNRFAIPVADDVKVDDAYIMAIQERIFNNEIEELSSKHIAENVFDAHIITEEGILNQFDADNDYLADWTKEKKLDWIHKLSEKL